MKLVILESPYKGDLERNLAYGRACLRNSLLRGEAPLASHMLYTQCGVLDDLIQTERDKGMEAGHAWMRLAEAVVVYVDHGLTEGMIAGIQLANHLKIPVEYRKLANDL